MSRRLVQAPPLAHGSQLPLHQQALMQDKCRAQAIRADAAPSLIRPSAAPLRVL